MAQTRLSCPKCGATKLAYNGSHALGSADGIRLAEKVDWWECLSCAHIFRWPPEPEDDSCE